MHRSPRIPHRPHSRLGLSLLGSVALLAACSQAPKLPSADESNRRPANSPGAVELQACRNELHNTRLLASESTRLAEATTAAMHQLALAKGAMVATVPSPSTVAGVASADPTAARASSTVYTFAFDNNVTQLALSEAATRGLVDAARQAALIVVRGRTDASNDAPMNAKAARERAEAAKDLLTAAGIDARRIRVTWQAHGDHVADNTSPEGKALNRRVEIEFYRTAPLHAPTGGMRPTTLTASASAGEAGDTPSRNAVAKAAATTPRETPAVPKSAVTQPGATGTTP